MIALIKKLAFFNKQLQGFIISLNGARILDPPMPKARRVEQNTHMVSNRPQGL